MNKNLLKHKLFLEEIKKFASKYEKYLCDIESGHNVENKKFAAMFDELANRSKLIFYNQEIKQSGHRELIDEIWKNKRKISCKNLFHCKNKSMKHRADFYHLPDCKNKNCINYDFTSHCSKFCHPK